MKRNEFIDFCRSDDNFNENLWHKFMKATDEKAEGPSVPQWKRREKMARADLIIKQKKESGETNKRKIVTAVVDATGVSRHTAHGWVAHWMQHHEAIE